MFNILAAFAAMLSPAIVRRGREFEPPSSPRYTLLPHWRRSV
jgi:hypothetical protein